MNAEAIQTIANAIITSAYEMAATKANTTTDEIRAVVMADPTGNCARYVFGLIACGIANVDNVLDAIREGRPVPADAVVTV